MFLLLCCEFSLLSFVLYVFGTVTFLLEGSIQRSTTNLQILGRRKKRVQRDKNGNANNVVVYAILAHPSNMQFLLKSQNTKVTNTQLKISYSKHNVTNRLPYESASMKKQTYSYIKNIRNTCRYHKIRKAFSKFNRRHFDIPSVEIHV